jgi:hypothetical protein
MHIEFHPKSLHELDKKGGGREIAGLKPKNEHFSSLEVDRDIEILKRNKEIKCNTNLDESYVFVNPKKGKLEMKVEAPHWRTISKENIHASYESEQGEEFFYTANTKGVGYLKPTLRDESLDDWDNWNRIDEYEIPGAFGLSDKDDFVTTDGDVVIKSKWLTDQGLRTELFSSFGRLKNLYYKGKLTSIKKLREEGIIPNQKEIIPQIGIRLLKTNTRIAEVKGSDEERSKELFEKAFEVFNKEVKDKKLNLPELKLRDPESEKIYFKTFFERMGQNLAVFQNIGYVGWHLHSANITLAAEIVDIGPYFPWRDLKDDEEFVKLYNGVRRGVWKDFRDIAYDLRLLIKAGKNINMSIPNRTELVENFMSEFSKKLDDEKLKLEKSERQDLETACRKVLEAVIIKKNNLGSLKHGADVKDWEL